MRILVIDDSANSREIIAGYLAALGNPATVCASAKEGMAELATWQARAPYQLVLMDWQMEGVDGFDAARQIRQKPEQFGHPKIIMVTAYGGEETQQRVRQEGLDGYLSKPVSASTLLDVLMNVCGRAQAETSLPEAATLGVMAEDKNMARLRGIRVLLTEDNYFNQQVAKELLEEVAGMEVRIANNGSEALDFLHGDEHFDCVLMDIQMPIMDGYEATRCLRSEARFDELPIIAMTAHAMQKDREACLMAGMNDYVSKPFDPAELFAVLAKWTKPQDLLKIPPAGTTAITPNFAALSAAGIDGALGLQRCLGRHDIYKKLLQLFLETHADSAKALSRLLQAGDTNNAAMLAHSLKSSAGTIGAEALSAAAQALENAIKIAALESCTALQQAFAAEMSKVLTALTKHLNTTNDISPD